jgi:histidine kinase
MPIVHQKKRVGLLYLENNLVTRAFTPARLRVLELLTMQAAISLENASLYETLEQKVAQRTREIRERNADLASALQRLQETREQLVVQEKLASLGTLTAGIAHELKNPLNFVNNFAELSAELTHELGDKLRPPGGAVGAAAWDDVDELLEMLRGNVTKIDQYGKRANNIINSMLLHARVAAGEQAYVDLNALLAESANLAYHGMRSKAPGFSVYMTESYGDDIGQVEVVAQDMSRVFINVVNNAYDAARQKARRLGPGYSPKVEISTKRLGRSVEIRVRDNGVGIPRDLVDKIWSPFFTTKPAGEGTGLGLSISYDIVVAHHGDITVETEEGEFTEMIIVLPAPPPPPPPASVNS